MGFKDLNKDTRTVRDIRGVTTFEDWHYFNYGETLEEITQQTYQVYDARKEEYLNDKTIRHEQ